MYTELGKYLRKMRIDRGQILKSMAEDLEVSSSFLSAVETGKKTAPDNFFGKIVELYDLDLQQQKVLKSAIEDSVLSVKINLAGASSDQSQTALMFARTFETMDKDKLAKIRQLLFENMED